VRSPQHLLDANADLLKREMQMFFKGQARVSQLLADAARAAQQRIEEASSAPNEGDAAQNKGRQTGGAAWPPGSAADGSDLRPLQRRASLTKDSRCSERGLLGRVIGPQSKTPCLGGRLRARGSL